MTAKTFTVLNNGNTNLNVTDITFNTPAGIRHRADLTNFGGSSNFTSASFVGSTSLLIGQSRTFSVEHEYISGPIDVRYGNITINSNVGAITTISTTIVVGTGGVVSLVNPLPGQGTYTATKTNPVDGRSYITLILSLEGVLTIQSVDGTGLNSNWLTPYPTSAGSAFWVRFTRSGYTGTGNFTSSGSTGWLQLSQSRFVEISATGLSNGSPSTASATYLVELSNNAGATVSASGTYTLSPTGTLKGVLNPLETITAYSVLYGNAEISFNRDGTRVKVEDQLTTAVQQWYLNGTSTVGDGYYIRASSVGSNLPDSGLLNTWLQLNQIRSWSIQPYTNVDCSLFIEISTSASALNIVSTGYINLISNSGNIDAGGFEGGFDGGNDGSGAPSAGTAADAGDAAAASASAGDGPGEGGDGGGDGDGG